MSISTGTISIPRKYESFKLLVANFTINVLEGKLASLVIPGAQGYVVADFVKNKASGVPHGAFGDITFIDGKSNGVLDVPGALIEIEEGAPEAGWPGKILGSFHAIGASTDGHAYIFTSRDIEQGGTSLLVDFAMADSAGIAGFSEVTDWHSKRAA